MDKQLTIQKYEEVRLTKNVNGHNGWVRMMIMKEGLTSFAQCPIPTKTCQSTPLPPLSTCLEGKGKMTEVLTTIILNIMGNEAAL